MSTLNLTSKNQSETQVRVELAARPEREVAYHEIPGLRHETRDVLKQLNSNVLLLEDLTGRLSFVLAEVRGLIRK